MLMYLIINIAMAQAPQVEAVPGEYLIKLKSQRSVHSLQSKVVGALSLKGQVSSGGVYQLKLSNTQDFQTLSQDPDVEYIEPNYILAKPQQPQGTASEPQALSESMMSASFSQNYAPVQVLQSWNEYSAFNINNRPVVAVIDTGVNLTHAALVQSDSLWRNPSELNGQPGVDDDQNGYVDDIYGWNFAANSSSPQDDEGHGTHVAGIVVGAGFDLFASPKPQSKIQVMSLKFLDANGSGRTSDAIRAIYYAVDNGAQVINCSWGGGSYSRALLDALAYAYSREVLVVTAAGNNSSNNDVSPMYPAGYDVPANLAVAATTDSDNLASFSNYGASVVPVAAPGLYIYSTYLGNNYVLMSGTSMAAPFVSGIAALAWREAPQLTGYQIKELIKSSVNVKASLTGKVSTNGRVNANSLVQFAKGSTSVLASQPEYKVSAERGVASEEAAAGAGGCGLVRALSGGSTGSGPLAPLGALLVLLVPLAVWFTLKSRSPESRRKFERFQVKSDVRINMGGREVVGQVQTLSMGGLSFSADDLIEKGSLVTMKISNPTGQGEIEVQGRIVWSEEKKAYGVQFQNASQTMSERILAWTKSLSKGAA